LRFSVFFVFLWERRIKMERISIADAPEMYRGYMARANEQGNNNAYLDGISETEKAIKEMAETEPGKLDGFLQYLREKGKYDPCLVPLLNKILAGASGYPQAVDNLCMIGLDVEQKKTDEAGWLPAQLTEATFKAISIKDAPADYQSYLKVGDESGNNDGKIDDFEALIAADLVCRQNRFFYKGFMDYLRKKGIYVAYPQPGKPKIGDCFTFEEKEPVSADDLKDKSFQFPAEIDRCKHGTLYNECMDVNRDVYRIYYGKSKKPPVEIDLGAALGAGYFLIDPIDAKGWEGIVNPTVGVDLNLTERVKAGYHLGYTYASVDDEHELHSIDHQLGASYDVLHYWPRERRGGGIELNLGGGLLLRNYFLADDNEVRKTFNAGFFAGMELGFVLSYGACNMSDLEKCRSNLFPGWSKLFLAMLATKGAAITDYSALLGLKFTFEVY
jgi:hypothetical protein